ESDILHGTLGSLQASTLAVGLGQGQGPGAATEQGAQAPSSNSGMVGQGGSGREADRSSGLPGSTGLHGHRAGNGGGLAMDEDDMDGEDVHNSLPGLPVFDDPAPTMLEGQTHHHHTPFQLAPGPPPMTVTAIDPGERAPGASGSVAPPSQASAEGAGSRV
ncbi:unnamed protein product, partial [Discosporangium mesarthrocarpum]